MLLGLSLTTWDSVAAEFICFLDESRIRRKRSMQRRMWSMQRRMMSVQRGVRRMRRSKRRTVDRRRIRLTRLFFTQ